MAVGTKFRPGAFAAFVDIPMNALVGMSVSVSEAFGADGARLQREVARHVDEAEQVGAVERFFAERTPQEDEGFELAVFHSHLSSPPRPSRTDVENIGLWQGKPYLILSLGTDSLAGWTINEGRIEPLAVVA